jgi:hypothetical protein
MNWIVTIATVLAFIIVGFILLVFMPKPKVFFDPYIGEIKHFPLEHDQLKKEIEDIADQSPVIPIFGNGIVFSDKYPILYGLTRSLPYVRYVGIINIKPKFEQVKQYGWARNADNTIRHFYTISHSAAQKSGIWVDGAKKFFYEKEWVIADMSREHSLFNKNKNSNTVLVFVDIDRIDINQGNSPNTDVEKDEVLKMFNLENEAVQNDDVQNDAEQT